MPFTEEERRMLFEEFERRKRQELSERMAALGRIKSDRKRNAVRENAKKARAAKLRKRIGT